MIDVANLVIEVDSRDIEQGRQALLRMAQTGGDAGDELATSMQRAEREFRDLKQSIDPAYRATIQYKQAVETVRNAVRTGAISQMEANRALQSVASRYRVAGAAAETYNMQVSRASRGMGNFGMAVQNASFQVADFAVMMGSGMGVTRSLATQLPQLLGGFGLWGAAIGAVVAIGGGYLSWLQQTRDEHEDWASSLDEAQAALDRANSTMTLAADTGLDRLRERYGQVTERVVELDRALRDLETRAATQKVQQAMEGLFTPEFLQEIGGDIDPSGIATAMLESTEEDIKSTREEIGYLEQQIENFPNLEPALRPQLEQLREELAAMNNDMENMGRLADEIDVSPDTVQQFRDLRQQIEEATAAGNFEEAADGISDLRRLAEEYGIALSEDAAGSMAKLEDLLRQAVQQSRDLEDNALGFGDAIGNAAADAGLLADELFRGAENLLSVQEQQLQRSRIRLEFAGDPVGEAAAMASERFGDISGVGGADRAALEAMREEYVANAEAIARNREELRERNAELRESSNSSGSASQAQREYNMELEAANKIYEQIAQSSSLYDEQLRRLEQQFLNGTISLDQYREALEQLKEEMSENEAGAKRLEDAFVRTATSILTGAENARQAVSNLLQSLGQMMVQSAMRDVFGGMFSSLSWLVAANGHAFTNGNVIPFEDGGVVGGPTIFPMSGGRTGLMGEAGPEAIVPLSRGPDGKLGVRSEGEQTIRLVVEAEEGEMFTPRVRQISGNVAVQVASQSSQLQKQAFGSTLEEYDQRGTTT